jgi:hypothetical protein
MRHFSTGPVAKLLVRKQRLLRRLRHDPYPEERDEIERLIQEIDAALNFLDEETAPRTMH